VSAQMLPSTPPMNDVREFVCAALFNLHGEHRAVPGARRLHVESRATSTGGYASFAWACRYEELPFVIFGTGRVIMLSLGITKP